MPTPRCEDFDVVQLVLKRRGVLPADDDAGSVLGLGRMNIGDRPHRTDQVVVFPQETLPFADITDALAEIFPDHAGDIDGGEAAGAHVFEYRPAPLAGLQTVDDDGVIMEFCGIGHADVLTADCESCCLSAPRARLTNSRRSCPQKSSPFTT